MGIYAPDEVMEQIEELRSLIAKHEDELGELRHRCATIESRQEKIDFIMDRIARMEAKIDRLLEV